MIYSTKEFGRIRSRWSDYQPTMFWHFDNLCFNIFSLFLRKEVVIYKTLFMKIHFQFINPFHEYIKIVFYTSNIQSVLKIEQNRQNIFKSKALAFYICNVKLIISFRVLFIMIINWKRVQFFNVCLNLTASLERYNGKQYIMKYWFFNENWYISSGQHSRK